MFAVGRAPGDLSDRSRPRPDVDRWTARPLGSVRRPPLKHDPLCGPFLDMPDFQPSFVAAGGHPIAYQGRDLFLACRLELHTAVRIHLLLERAASDPVQGLRIRAANRRHILRVGDVGGHSLVFWTDTSPRHSEIALPATRTPLHLLVRNVWKFAEDGPMMMGINAAAMGIVEEAPGRWLLECSDGFGVEPHFDDLVARLVVEPPSAARWHRVRPGAA
jgi:hypothetical protein